MKRHNIHPTIRSRAREMRKNQTEPEAKLWSSLRRKQLSGYKFRRQYPIDRFIVDFYCHQVQLIIELDGESHVGQELYDCERTAWLESRGYKVIRFWNNEVMQNREGVLLRILEVCEARTVHLPPLNPPQRGGDSDPPPFGRG